MRQRALGLAVAIIGCFALVSASGAATTKTQHVTKINVSTRAAVIHYLRSIHVSTKHVVIQRGLRNYAGGHCPGKGWTCASTRHTVVQIAKRGGQNRYACTTRKCAVVQFASATRLLHAAAKPPPPSYALCVKTTGVTQSCVINQPNASGQNKAVVYMVTPKNTGLTQSSSYTASITQGPASAAGSSNNNLACVKQFVWLDGSTTKTNTASTTVTNDNHMAITITQNSLSGTNTVQGVKPSGATYDCDSTHPLSQDELLTSVVNSKGGSITQNQDKATTNPQGVPAANVVTDIEQNQGSGFKGFASGENNANFEQSTKQVAIANTPKGTVIQQQNANVPNLPYSGIVGTINQDSKATSTAVVNQDETQCQDAVVQSTPIPAPTAVTGSGSVVCPAAGDAGVPPGVTLSQTQWGPVLTPSTGSAGRVPFYHKGYGQSEQTGAGTGVFDSFTLTQHSSQKQDDPGDNVTLKQANTMQGDCASSGDGSASGGSCTASQTATLDGPNNTTGFTTSDGYTAGSISQLTIKCTNGHDTCEPTPPPKPTFVSGPSDPNPSASAAFNFTDTATGGIHFVCAIDGNTTSPVTCQNGVPFSQGYGPHTFQVAASDSHGNVSAYVPTTPFSWTNVPPDPTITASSKPADGEAWGGTDTFQFTDTESPVHFKCTLDGNTTSCNTGNKSYSSLPSGQHTFSVRAYDLSDTYGSIHSASYTWWITPPDPTITSSPPALDFLSSTPMFTFTDDDNTVQYQCQVDSQPAASCNSGVNYPGLSAGPHTFTVTAYGANDSGLTHPDTTPPTASWTILPLEVSALGGDDGSSAGWACQPGGPIALTVGSTPYDPDTGIGTFAQVAIADAAGTSIDDLSEPTFTTDNFGAGSPRYTIDLGNGDFLWGYPPNTEMGTSAMLWDGSVGYGKTWSQVQAIEQGRTVTDAYVIADNSQGFNETDNIGNLQFNGTTFNSGSCSLP